MCQRGTGDSAVTAENGNSLNWLVLPPGAYPCVDLHRHLDPAQCLLEDALDIPTSYKTGTLHSSAQVH